MSNKIKIIERVKKLLAMAEDKSSPHEASIAIRRARKLMDEHQLSRSDFKETSEPNFISKSQNQGARTPNWYKILMMGVSKLNDCHAGVKTSKVGRSRRSEFVFTGLSEDILSAEVMMVFLVSAADKNWLQTKSLLQKTGEYSQKSKNQYYLGFAHEIKNRISSMLEERQKESNEHRGLITYKSELIAKKFNISSSRTVYTKSDVNNAAYQKGKEKAKSLHLGQQVTEDRETKLD